MQRILVGLILIMFDVIICPRGNSMVRILPDFIGYYLLVSGFRKVVSENVHFDKAKPVAVLMMIYTTVIYIPNIIAGTILARTAGMLMVNAFTLAGFLYILYNVIAGTEELQKKCQIKSSSSVMKWQWGVIAAGKIISYVFNAFEMLGRGKGEAPAFVYSPLPDGMNVLYYILIAMISIISLSFIVEFNKRRSEIAIR